MSTDKLSQDQFIQDLRKLGKKYPRYAGLINDFIARIEDALETKQNSLLDRFRK